VGLEPTTTCFKGKKDIAVRNQFFLKCLVNF
jgi:hypothetical protein